MRIGSGPAINRDWLYEIRNSRGFTGAATPTGAAGQYAHVQLLNPAASGVTVVARRIMVSTNTTDTLDVRTYDTALTTNVATLANVRLGGPAPLAQINQQSNAAPLGTFLRAVRILANTNFEFASDWYFLLAAGKGILVLAETVATQIVVNYDWIEF